MSRGRRLFNFALAAFLVAGGGFISRAQPVEAGPFSPTALAASPDGRQLFVACASTNCLLVLDTKTLAISRTMPLPGPASGLALSADGLRVFVTCPSPASQVLVLNAADGHVEAALPAGHTALSPVLGHDASTLYVCSRFDNAITVLDLKANASREGYRGTLREAQGGARHSVCAAGNDPDASVGNRGAQRTDAPYLDGQTRAMKARIPVAREPVSAALTPDGRLLLVANHLPSGPATAPVVSARVSLINTATRMVIKEIPLPDGSIDLRGIQVSPAGRFACVAHVLARYQVPTFKVEQGWMAGNALTVIDLQRREILNTVLLDDADRGAANPWALAWTADGRRLCVTHAGTHELSVIDWPGLLAKLGRLRDGEARRRVPNDLSFIGSVRRRVALKLAGPRALAVIGSRVFVAGYFSDSLDVVDLARPDADIISINLSRENALPLTRLGEAVFNDATICHQGWLSCATCHGDDGRTDAINWDLPNDGVGNPKKARSLLFSHVTPPVMSLGIRANSAIAVRSGFRNSLFSIQPEAMPAAIDAWIAALKPVPSPHLVAGSLSPAAKRGEKLFHSRRVGCADCHAGDLFTDLGSYEVGTRGTFDKSGDNFDTPTLREVWRTGPYLHDGSAATLREVLTTRNRTDQHGSTSQLAPWEIEDLLAYVLSL